jgi:phosphoribosylformylglycinamidine cyclo-ligase
LHAAAHITGGGITENMPRVLPAGLAARIDLNAWKIPPVFELLRRAGDVPLEDWRRTFNLGIGMILVVPASQASRAAALLKQMREKPVLLGEVVPHRRARPRVVYQ